MSLYVDSSALLKLYIDEPESEVCDTILAGDPQWLCSRIGFVEIRRNLSRLLSGKTLANAQSQFLQDWSSIHVVEVSVAVSDRAAEIAEATSCRSLDALHLGALAVSGAGAIPLVTYDRRQAGAARSLGWTVLGV